MLEMLEGRIDCAIVRRVGEVVGACLRLYGGRVAMMGVYYVMHGTLRSPRSASISG